jgi:uncharacterized delta-60 repeat protein/uncharacterized repeat protein (TIGR02543 family)
VRRQPLTAAISAFAVAISIVTVSIFPATRSHASAGAGSPDMGFSASISADSLDFTEGTVTAVQSDGKILVGGTVNSNGDGKIVRLLATGAIDNTFTPIILSGVSGSSGGRPTDIDFDTLGGFFVSGYFDTASQGLGPSQSSPLVVHVTSAGEIDANYSSNLSSATIGIPHYLNVAGSYGYSVEVDSTGRVILGGWYQSGPPMWGAFNYYGLLRLNADGSYDSTFTQPFADDYVGVYTVFMNPDDSFYVGGGGLGTGRATIAKILANGQLDGTFNPPTSFTKRVDSLAVQSDRKVVAGGGDSSSAPAITRFNSDGTVDSTLATPSSLGGFYPSILSMAIQPNGDILMGGNFNVSGGPEGYLSRMSGAGVLDTTFNSNVAALDAQGNQTVESFNGMVNYLALQPDGKLLVAGSMNTPSRALAQYATVSYYTVTYSHGLGGTGADLVETIAQGSTLTLPSPAACPLSATDPCFTAPSGQRQNGWQVTAGALSGGSTYPMTGATVTPTSNVTLAARWTGGPLIYSTTSFASGGTAMSTISFPNTAVNATADITVYAKNSGSAALSVSNGGPSPNSITQVSTTCGSTFAAGAECSYVLRWSPTVAGAIANGELSFQVSGSYFDAVALSGTAAVAKTVTFNRNGGLGTMANQVSAFAANLNNIGFTYAGYTFRYWTLFSDGSGSSWLNQASYDFANTATLYAQWSADSHVVTYDTDGGSSVANGSFNTDGSMNLPSAPTRNGYIFNGWFTSPSGGTALSSPYSPSATSAITLYAQWSVDANGGGSGSNLPYTGSGTGPIIGLGGGLLGLGLVTNALSLWRRRRTN